MKAIFRQAFKRTLILSGCDDAVRAESDLQAGKCDLVAFGRPFLANPDLEPETAERVRGLIQCAGLAAHLDTTRGYDHGTFTPLLDDSVVRLHFALAPTEAVSGNEVLGEYPAPRPAGTC